MANKSSFEEFIGQAMAGMVVLAMILMVWAMVKAFELVARVFIAHPHHRALWVALAVFSLTLAAAGLTQGQYVALDLSAGLTFLGLLGTCKVVELMHDQLMQPELDRELFAHEVLQSWWQL